MLRCKELWWTVHNLYLKFISISFVLFIWTHNFTRNIFIWFIIFFHFFWGFSVVWNIILFLFSLTLWHYKRMNQSALISDKCKFFIQSVWATGSPVIVVNVLEIKGKVKYARTQLISDQTNGEDVTSIEELHEKKKCANILTNT